ncbi:MAG TPA: hypothetical protein VM912_12025, partial [Terriglobales bacterium]|nr:hypothetical protein [Terriglobales bacterium]
MPGNKNILLPISPAPMMSDVAQDPDKLRNLASWYREFAEQAGNPVIWESRLFMAESLEREAKRIERVLTADRGTPM